MAKVEVLKGDSGFFVRATFREPFEYFFEIADHNARFESAIDARDLADRVQAALKENGWQSPSFVIKRDFWTYNSSAYDPRMGTTGKIWNVPMSRKAKEIEQKYMYS